MFETQILLIAPVSSRSGYGQRARDIAYAISLDSTLELKIIDIPWGNTPLTALNDGSAKAQKIRELLVPGGRLDRQPDVCIHCTVPNEFQPIGKYNIGLTAGIETTACSKEWIEGCNRMHMVWTSSNHSKEVFEKTSFVPTGPDGKANPNMEVIKVKVPVEVLMEGVDLSTFFSAKGGVKELNPPTEINRTEVTEQLNTIKEHFNFLFVGHWLQGNLGHDRKDLAMLIKTFLETFKGVKNKPGLILKTGSTFSPIDRQELLMKIDMIRKTIPASPYGFPNIYILFGELTDDQMNELYNHPRVTANISFTKGEGFGRPLAEAALSQKPTLVSNWSGLLDFMKYSILLPGKIVRVDPSAVWDKVIIPESGWFQVDYAYASQMMKSVFEDVKMYERSAKKQATFIRKEFSFEKMKEQLLLKLHSVAPKNITETLILPKMNLKQLNLPSMEAPQETQKTNE